MKPVRVQLSRRKGWKMPENTVSVARPTLYSNPFPIGKPSGYLFKDGGDPTPMIAALTREQSIEFFREMVEGFIRPEMHPWGHEWNARLHKKVGGYYPYSWVFSQLKGKNLACWCGLDEACHADVLLELSNPMKCEAAA